MARTHNGDFTYDHSGSALVEFFAKAGAQFSKKKSHYGEETSALDLFKPAWDADQYKAMQLMAWLRDCRGGAGNRSGFRSILAWVGNAAPEWIKANIAIIPMVGRWDDLESLVGTPCEESALKHWVEAIQGGNGLAAKWAPRADKNKDVFNKMRKLAGLGPKEYRKMLVAGTKVVETLMCSGKFDEIAYSHIPSVASARYAKAFERHDAERYGKWKDDLESGKEKVNASVLFPHDVLRTLKAGDENVKLANAQFDALPDYMADKNARIMSICDFSGSMGVAVSGSVEAIDVSLSLGLYCSGKLSPKNPFYKMFIPFSSDSRLVDWKDKTFAQAATSHEVVNGWVGSTNVTQALQVILKAGKMFKAKPDDYPTMLLIISHIQFSHAVLDTEASIETALKEWERIVGTRPKVVYWNMSSYAGSVETCSSKDIGLISGFSPSLLKAVLGGDSFDPISIMNRALEKYVITSPV